MFPKFADRIRAQLLELIQKYDERLCLVPGYNHLPVATRQDLERRVLELIADSAANSDETALILYIQERAEQVLARGFRLEWFQQAVVIAQDIIVPLTKTVAESNFAWRMLNHTQSTVSDIANREWQRNIDAVKATTQALQESEERLRTVADFTYSWETWLLPDGHYAYVSPACQRISGYTAQEFIDRPELFAEIVHLEDRAAVADHLLRHSTTLDTGPLEFRLVTRDGRTRWINHICAPVYDAQGVFQGRRGSNTDGTDRKQAEETAKKSARLFQSLFEKSGDAILLLEDGIFTDCNQATVEMMRADDKQQFLSLHPSRLSPEYQPDGRPSGEKADEMIRTALERGGHRFEWMHRRVDGSDFPVEVLLTPITIDDRQVIYTVWRDITRRKRNEEETRVRLKVAQALSGATTEDQVLDGILEAASLYTSARIIIYTTEKTADETFAVVRRDESFQSDIPAQVRVGMRLPTARLPILETLATENIFCVDNLLTDPRVDEGNRALALASGSRGFLAVPLAVGGEMMGLITASSRQEGYFDENKVHLYLTLAEQASTFLRDARLQDQARASQQRLSLLIEQSPLAAIEWNTNFEVVSWNPAAERIFGYSAAEAQGRHAAGLIIPVEYRETVDQVWADLLTQRGGTRSTNGNVTKDGRAIMCEWFNSPLVNAEGQVFGVASLVEDITERQRLEAEIQDSLERRGRQVQTSTEVAQEIAAAPALDELFNRVVTLVKERFDYYHAQIFRYAPAQEAMVLVTGYGEAGQKMLAAGHKLPMRRGVVGTAAATGHSILAANVAEDQDWRPNPNLPNTRGELAVPIKLRDQVLGVLDVQSDQTGALTREDQLLLEGLCGQIAVASEHTRALQEARMFRQLTEAAGQGIAIANPQAEMIYANPALAQLFGVASATELAGQSVLSFYPPELQEQVSQMAIPTALQSGQWRGELDVLDVAGQTKPTLNNVFPIYDDQGQLQYLANIVTDITERKQAEETLRRSEAQLSEALEIAKLAYWEYDVEKDLFLFNDQFYALFHTTAAQVGGYQISSAQYAERFVYAEDLPIVGAEIEKALNSTERHYTRDLVHRIQYADGDVGYISVNINIDRDEQGRILRYYGANQDVTAARLAEQALRETEERFRVIAETAPIPILISRVADGEVMYGNEYLGQMIGIAIADLIGQQTPDFYFDTADRPPMMAQLKRDGMLRNYELRLKRADATPFWTLVSMRPMIFDGQAALLSAFYDITDRKEMEVELSKFKLGLERSASAIFMTDRQGIISYVNPAFEQMYGYHAAEAVGQTPRILKSGHTPREEYQGFWDALLAGETVLSERINRTKDGRLITAEANNTPILDEHGQVMGFLSMHIDVSERKAAERKVTESERLLRTLIDAIPDYIYAKDLQGRHILGNAALARLYGMNSVQDMIGKSDFDLYPAELAQQYFASEQPIMRDGKELLAHEEPNLDAEGQQKWNSTTKVPLRDQDGKIIGLVGITSDITRRKEIEVELARSAQMLRTIIDTSRDLIYIKDIESRFVVASQAVADLFGVKSASELIGKRDFDFYPQELAQKYYDDEQHIIQRGEPLIDIEEPAVRADGTPIWLLTTKIPYRGSDGALMGLVGIGRDITERKAEEQRMAETLREVERLYATVSHEEWQTYRETEQLPDGYLFNRLEIQPAPQVWEPEVGQAVGGLELVAKHDEQRAVVAAPLAVRGEVIGALGVYDRPDQPLTAEELALVKATSEQVALALESARLFDQIQRDAERERVINRVTSQIRNASTVDQVLEIAAQELSLLTHASRSVVEIAPRAAAQKAGNGNQAAP